MPAMSIGASESDIDVSLVDDILTIRADKKLRKTDDKESYHFMELPTEHSLISATAIFS